MTDTGMVAGALGNPLVQNLVASLAYEWLRRSAAWAHDKVLGGAFMRAWHKTLEVVADQHGILYSVLSKLMENERVVAQLNAYAAGHSFDPAVLAQAFRAIPAIDPDYWTEGRTAGLIGALLATLRDHILLDVTLAHFYQARLLESIDNKLAAAAEPKATAAQLETLAQEASRYYSCFISYSSKDAVFVDRLYTDLQAAGVRCWFAPEDMHTGDKVREALDWAVMARAKLLLVLSESSIESQYVEQEVETALETEQREGRTLLFPVRLDGAVMDVMVGWPAYVRRTRFIGDFRQWRDEETYAKALKRLLRDLPASEG